MLSKQLVSHKEDPKSIANDLKGQLGNDIPKALLVFSSWSHDHGSLIKELEGAFPCSTVFGCSSYGEYIQGSYFKNSTVVMALGDELIEDISVEVIEDVHKDLKTKTKNAFRSFENHYGEASNRMNLHTYVGMVLVDWCMIEEKVMEHIGDYTNVVFVGGTSADKDFVDFKEHSVFAQGKAFRDSAVLVLMKPKRPFEIIKTQSFRVLNEKLMATKVDEEKRLVHEFNGKPALEEYARALNVDVSEAENYFWTNPVGIVVTDHPFVRSPIPGGEDGSIMFCCNILKDMDAHLLEETEIVDETDALIKRINKKQDITALIQFNCSARTIELENRDLIHEYANIFNHVPHVGISCFGESYIAHINQSATMLVFR
ncbi:FIST C-terminal domain-containing protein (plasmid) [Pontibacillus sp. ALD_SL1]|uniref:FIST signal transduction protein n=1 Tax=Pontibacillus sp. ALD_SL1 TaxID=2777185 RepID=UPI001A95B0A3|nr:FIST N-terminal domain-containing protein [Pontibacillus sp. ALD_SL1]QST03106.1 FIST C-terminal domain-containing protein [Pontibacillus sp. ALD_SL1]